MKTGRIRSRKSSKSGKNSKADGRAKDAVPKKKKRGRKPGWGQNLPKEPTSDKQLLDFNTSSDNFLKVQLAKKSTFLGAFAKIGTVTGAARQAGIDRGTHVNWLKNDAEYAARFADAEYEAADYIEQEIRRRALVGTEEPVYGIIYGRDKDGGETKQSGVIGTVRKYSDMLAMFLMKKLRPEFRENGHLIVKGDPRQPVLHLHGVVSGNGEDKEAQLDYAAFAAGFEAMTKESDEQETIEVEAEEVTQ